MSAPAAAPAAPAAARQAQAPNLVDLDDLLTPTPAQAPQQADLMGFTPQQNMQHPVMGGQAAAMPQMGAVATSNSDPQQSASMPQQQQQQQQQPKPGGPAPMAPRGNAAVEQGAGRQDPFADLFS